MHPATKKYGRNLIKELEAAALTAPQIENEFFSLLKQQRQSWYLDRGPKKSDQTWLPVLRPGYEEYVVSNWGFVRHRSRDSNEILALAYDKSYPRAPMRAPYRRGGAQNPIFELVFESFTLKHTLEELCRRLRVEIKGSAIIEHIDRNRWNPSNLNLTLTDLGLELVSRFQKTFRRSRVVFS